MSETTPSAKSLTDDIAAGWDGHRWAQANGGDRCECGYFGWGELHLASIAASVVSARAEALAREWEARAADCERSANEALNRPRAWETAAREIADLNRTKAHRLRSCASSLRRSLVADKETGDA